MHDSQLAVRELELWPADSPHRGKPGEPPRLVMVEPPHAGAASAEGRPAVIVLPGGGYGMLADHEGRPVAELFARHGLVGFVCHYRVAPHRFPLPYADAARAVRLVRSQAEALGVDPQRIALMGFSAGGHNACTVATQPDLHLDPHDDLAGRVSARPDRQILAYPVVSFVDSVHTGSWRNLLGEAASEAQRLGLSNERFVSEATPPTFLFHTADDPVVPVANALHYASACRQMNVPVELHVYEHGRHGVGLAPDEPKLRSWPRLLLDWLDDWVA